MMCRYCPDYVYRYNNYYPMVWDWTDQWKEDDFESYMDWYLDSELCSIVLKCEVPILMYGENWGQ